MSPSLYRSFITIAICTCDRDTQIGDTLDTLRQNAYPDFRVLVVDQSRNASTYAIIREFQRVWSRLDYIHSDVVGLSAARNLAITASSSPILAFTDDDCLVSPNWVAQIADAFIADAELGVLFGRVLPDQGLNADQLPVAVQPSRQEQTLVGLPNLLRINLFTFGSGNSMALRRSKIPIVGRFDEGFGAGSPLNGGEDIDYLYRALVAGLKVTYNPLVLSYHKMWRSAAQVDTLYLRTHVSAGALLAKHLILGTPRARLYALSRFWYFIVRPAIHGLVRASPWRIRRSVAAAIGTTQGIRRYRQTHLLPSALEEWRP